MNSKTECVENPFEEGPSNTQNRMKFTRWCGREAFDEPWEGHQGQWPEAE